MASEILRGLLIRFSSILFVWLGRENRGVLSHRRGRRGRAGEARPPTRCQESRGDCPLSREKRRALIFFAVESKEFSFPLKPISQGAERRPRCLSEPRPCRWRKGAASHHGNLSATEAVTAVFLWSWNRNSVNYNCRKRVRIGFFVILCERQSKAAT